MKYILINDNDSNLIDLLDLLLKLLTKSNNVIENRKNIITNENIKIVPILFSKLESICSTSYKILYFNNIPNPKDFVLSLIIDIFKYLYSYDTLLPEENKNDSKKDNISKNVINNIKIISFNISIERNLALNLSIINYILENDLDEMTFNSLFDFCVVSVDSKNNLDEILFEILFQRLNHFKENIAKSLLSNLLSKSKSDEYFLSRLCDLPYFFLYFNNWLIHLHEISILIINYY